MLITETRSQQPHPHPHPNPHPNPHPHPHPRIHTNTSTNGVKSQGPRVLVHAPWVGPPVLALKPPPRGHFSLCRCYLGDHQPQASARAFPSGGWPHAVATGHRATLSGSVHNGGSNCVTNHTHTYRTSADADASIGRLVDGREPENHFAYRQNA